MVFFQMYNIFWSITVTKLTFHFGESFQHLQTRETKQFFQLQENKGIKYSRLESATDAEMMLNNIFSSVVDFTPA